MRNLGAPLLSAVAAFALLGCAPGPTSSLAPSPSLVADFPVDCGPIQDIALCQKAIDVAATAKLNPPPIATASIRRPRADDACASVGPLGHACGAEAIIVVIQSGDTLQDIALVRTSDGWVRLDLVR